MSKNIVFEGWLTKSPPTKRIWRAKWRRRWFALRQSGELPGQYLLDYYADRNCRRLKGTINLDLCEQVDAGLRMERGNGTLDNKIRGSVFTVRTQSRTYHLEAECEEDMSRWVDAICRVCGLRATEDSSDFIGTFQNSPSRTGEHGCPDGVYIPISECITGVRVQDMRTAFTFDPKNIVTSNRFERISSRSHTTESRLNATDNWDNESNGSAEYCASLNASQSHIENWSVTKSFTKLSVNPKKNGNGATGLATAADEGPPVPPRPPKTFHGPKLQEPVETNIDSSQLASRPSPPLFVPRRMSHGHSPISPACPVAQPRYTDDEDEASAHPSMQYCNMTSLPPAVDRARKPRYGVHSHSIGHIHTLQSSRTTPGYQYECKDKLQYLDLDLPASKSAPSKVGTGHQSAVALGCPVPTIQEASGEEKLEFAHGKSLSAVESDYKTVDFLKTEAFNITRQDAEASRSEQY